MGSYRLSFMEIQWNILALTNTTKSNGKSQLAEILEMELFFMELFETR